MEKKPLDRIRINRLKARTYVGFNDWEKEKKQDVALSVTLHADLEKACESDNVGDTVDYKDLKTRILDLVEGARFSLIEAMAEAVANLCFEDYRVKRVDVVVDKLLALRFADSVQVEITRFRDEVSTRGQDA